MARRLLFALLFVGLCQSQFVLADEPASNPSATTAQVKQSVDRALGYLQKESAAWLSTRQCAACHHVPIPLWAVNEAGRQGYAIDKKFVADTTAATLNGLETLMSSRIFPDPKQQPDTRPLGRTLNVGAVFLMIAAQSLPTLQDGQKQTLGLITTEILKKQQANGSWEFFEDRTPIHESESTDAVWFILALQGEAGRDLPPAERAAIEKAMAWLDVVKLPDTHQGQVLKVLLAIRTGQPRSAVQTDIDKLLAAQQADGGWRQTVDRPSDAYATGQTLYALALAGYTTEQPEIRRALDFLVATQQPDGSWPMTSRSSVNGRSTRLLSPITATATAWVILGVTRLVPEKPAP